MLAVRKCKTKGKKMTAHEVLSPGFVDNIVKQDDGFRVLRIWNICSNSTINIS
jgi:hypothetical protein